MNKNLLNEFFTYIVKRQMIYYNKEILKEKFPWTDDEILQKYKFCNVFRKRDRISKLILDTLSKIQNINKSDLLYNLIIFRFFNRQETIESIGYTSMYDNKFLLEKLLKMKSDGITLRNMAYRNSVTFEKLFTGMDIEKIQEISERLYHSKVENLFTIIKQCGIGLGSFLSYQILLDLVYFNFWDKRITDDDFVCVGGGAYDMLESITGSKIENSFDISYTNLIKKEQKLYLSDITKNLYNISWEEISDKELTLYPWLSNSDIEFNLCEFRKYKNISNNIGKRRLYIHEN